MKKLVSLFNKFFSICSLTHGVAFSAFCFSSLFRKTIIIIIHNENKKFQRDFSKNETQQFMNNGQRKKVQMVEIKTMAFYVLNIT